MAAEESRLTAAEARTLIRAYQVIAHDVLTWEDLRLCERVIREHDLSHMSGAQAILSLYQHRLERRIEPVSTAV
jgi:hypothetical protein